MKKQKKNNGRQPAPAAPKSAAPRREPTADEIRDRAYQLYLQRGGTQGRAIDDWLTAERELRTGKS